MFKKHKAYKIVPAIKLDNAASFAFNGAKYHFEKVKENFNGPAIQTGWEWTDQCKDQATKQKLQDQIYQFYWHLRAFFWEMVGTFETILQWANQRYELGVPEDKVLWSRIPKLASKDQSEWDKKYALLKSAWESDWYFEVRMYRNFAHRGFLFAHGEYRINQRSDREESALNIMSLLPVREGQQNCTDIIQQLSGYLEEMRRLEENIFRI
jgi:hypothetical protein